MKNKFENKIIAGIAAIALCFNFGFVFAEDSTVITEPTMTTLTTKPESNRGTKGQVGPVGDPGNIAPTGNITTTTKPAPAPTSSEEQKQEGIITGVNDASQNSGNGTIDSGSGNVSAGALNTIGSSLDGPLASGNNAVGTISGNIYLDNLSGQGLVTQNSTTGTNSFNSAETDILNQLLFNGQNTVNLTNNLPLNINTGDNAANYNTGNADIQSGDVNLSLNLINLIHSALSGEIELAVLDVYGDYTGDIIVPRSNPALDGINNILGQIYVIDNSNRNTGSYSKDTAETELVNEIRVNVDSSYGIANNVPIIVNTGGNEVNYNTGHSSVESGSINIGGNEAGILNVIFDGESWYLVLVNVLGNWFGSVADGLINNVKPQVAENAEIKKMDVTAENQNTGGNSENTGSAEINNQTDINLFNNAEIKNNYDVNINTGNNQANYNTGNASILSGSVNILANFVNFIESQINAKNIYVFIANIFGNWTGGVKYGDKKIVDIKPEKEAVKESHQESQVEYRYIEVGETKGGNLAIKGGIVRNAGTLRIDGKNEIKLPVPAADAKNESQVKSSVTGVDTKNRQEEGSSVLREVAQGGMIFSLILMAATTRYQRKKTYKK